MNKRSTAKTIPIKRIENLKTSNHILNTSIDKGKILNQLASAKESYLVINELKEITGLNLNFLAQQVFEITPKTLSSYREKGKYLPKRSFENSIKIKELYHKGQELFGSNDAFNKWLNTQSYGLDNIVPISLIGYSTGIDVIYEELARIEFGATA
jgi:putative toxin-antitoxin system antitoxin component (TIGR02293 family)